MFASSKRILIVEDEFELRDAVKFELELEGASVLTADSGTSVLAILAAESVDFVLSDVRMPNGTGIDLLKNIKLNKKYQFPVMLYSGYSELGIENAKSLGAYDLIAKPFDPEKLVQVIIRALNC